MSAAWVSVAIAATANLGGAALVIWRVGRWTGTVTTILKQLREDRKDHERRLRVLEGGRH